MTREQELIVRVKQGDIQAFEPLIEAYEKQIYHLCLRMTGNPEDARDLTQEAFLKAWQKLGQYHVESAFSTWLYRLSSNLCIDFLRQQKRRTVFSLTTEEDTGEEMEVASADPTPEEVILEMDDRRAVADAMKELDEDHRLILTLRVVEDMPYEQIAQVLGVKEGTVKSRLARARTKLRRILLQNGNYFGSASSNYVKGEDAR